VAHYAEDAFALAFARIENHYFQGRGFFERDDQLLADAAGALGREIPVTIVSGRYDLVCPHESAYLLAQALPHATHVVVPDAGHSAWEDGIQTALLDATDAYRPGGSGGGTAAPAS
jgi:proline iminopeptidase